MEPKQVIVMLTKFTNKDGKIFKPRLGKMAAQAAHASLKVILNMMKETASPSLNIRQLELKEDSPVNIWLAGSFTKVVVGVESLDELMDIYWQAKEAGIPTALIKDEGRTEFEKPTITCVSIGPHWADEINKITGSLKLL